MITGLIQVECKSYLSGKNAIFCDLYKKIEDGEVLCPNCCCNVKTHSFYYRKVILSELEVARVEIMQVKCISPACGKTHAILPDFVMPLKQYDKNVIMRAVNDCKSFDGSADESTILRWRKCVIAT